MTRIWLKHEDHGEKIAYLEAEAEMDERHGWVRFDPTKKAAPVAPAESEADIKPRRGRPPKEKSNAAE